MQRLVMALAGTSCVSSPENGDTALRSWVSMSMYKVLGVFSTHKDQTNGKANTGTHDGTHLHWTTC